MKLKVISIGLATALTLSSFGATALGAELVPASACDSALAEDIPWSAEAVPEALATIEGRVGGAAFRDVPANSDELIRFSSEFEFDSASSKSSAAVVARLNYLKQRAAQSGVKSRAVVLDLRQPGKLKIDYKALRFAPNAYGFVVSAGAAALLFTDAWKIGAGALGLIVLPAAAFFGVNALLKANPVVFPNSPADESLRQTAFMLNKQEWIYAGLTHSQTFNMPSFGVRLLRLLPKSRYGESSEIEKWLSVDGRSTKFFAAMKRVMVNLENERGAGKVELDVFLEKTGLRSSRLHVIVTEVE